MPFGLVNAPATFQRLVNNVLRPFLDISVVVYLDNILIFSDGLEQHVKHVKEVLERLAAASLYIKLEKYSFHVKTIEFLGYVIALSSITIDSKKVESIITQPTPRLIKDVQSFLSLANFYRRFIKEFSKILAGLTILLKKDNGFYQDKQQESSFKRLKE